MSDETNDTTLEWLEEDARCPFEVAGVRERDLLVVRCLERADLRGQHFYSFDKRGVLQWQGKVLAQEGDVLRVELGEWFSGQPNGERTVPLSDVVDWVFYEDHAKFLEDIRWLAAEECRLGEAQERRRARLSHDRLGEVS